MFTKFSPILTRMLAAIRALPLWGISLFTASLTFKLYIINSEFNIGLMNDWKWKVTIGAVLLTCFWTLFLGHRTRVITLVILDFILSIVIFADLVYFRFFKDFISMPILFQAGQVGKLEDSILAEIYTRDIIYFIDIPFAIAFAIWHFRHFSPKKNPNLQKTSPLQIAFLWRKLIPALLVFCLGWSLVHFPVQEQKKGWARGLMERNWWNVPMYNVLGLLAFHGFDIERYAKDNWFSKGISQEEVDRVQTWFKERHKAQQKTEKSPMFGKYKGKNVILVQTEAFQDFLLNQRFLGKEITPNLNALLKKSLYFKNFYQMTASGRTSDADLNANCSLHAATSGSVFVRFAANTFDCLPEALNQVGYDTTVQHPYDGSFYNRTAMYLNMKYHQYYKLDDYKNDEPIGWSIGDKTFFRQSMEQLAARKKKPNQPFYAFMITLTGHHPFDLPAKEQQKFDVGPLEGKLLGKYIQNAYYVDAAFGELIADLKQRNLWDDTIFMFYGDHDNNTFDWEDYTTLFGHPVSDLNKDRMVRKVPFLIHFPQDKHAGIHTKTAGQIDISPTIMELLGIPIHDRYMMGLSMFSKEKKAVVFRNGAYTDDKHYFIPNKDGIVEHGTCYAIDEINPVQVNTNECALGAAEASKELQISDLLIENDLIPRLRNESK